MLSQFQTTYEYIGGFKVCSAVTLGNVKIEVYSAVSVYSEFSGLGMCHHLAMKELLTDANVKLIQRQEHR